MQTRVFCLVLALALLVPFSSFAQPEADAMPEESPFSPATAWITYWDDLSGMEEALHYERSLESLIYFGAFFAKDDSLFLPPELVDMKQTLDFLLEDPKPVSYLSIINDYTLPDGSYLQKDTAVLTRVLQGAQSETDSAGALIQEILALALKHGYQGIEIDFESLLNDLALWEHFLEFVKRLHAAAEARGLLLRVVLEPRTPFSKLSFPPGPEYVMMCYNLFGTHSGPGPKANEAFLRELVAKMSTLPEGKKSFALATGGVEWWGEKARSLSYQQAEALRKQSGQEALRTEHALQFFYTDESGIPHEVWYADEQTLAFWSKVITSLGDYGINVWRLGGNMAP